MKKYLLALVFCPVLLLAGQGVEIGGIPGGQIADIAEIALAGLGALAALFTAVASLTKAPEDDRYASGFQMIVNRLSLLPLGILRGGKK